MNITLKILRSQMILNASLYEKKINKVLGILSKLQIILILIDINTVYMFQNNERKINSNYYCF